MIEPKVKWSPICSAIVTIATGIIIIAISKLNTGFECKKSKIRNFKGHTSKTGVKQNQGNQNQKAIDVRLTNYDHTTTIKEFNNTFCIC